MWEDENFHSFHPTGSRRTELGLWICSLSNIHLALPFVGLVLPSCPLQLACQGKILKRIVGSSFIVLFPFVIAVLSGPSKRSMIISRRSPKKGPPLIVVLTGRGKKPSVNGYKPLQTGAMSQHNISDPHMFSHGSRVELLVNQRLFKEWQLGPG